jgi:hypothetical protein
VECHLGKKEGGMGSASKRCHRRRSGRSGREHRPSCTEHRIDVYLLHRRIWKLHVFVPCSAAPVACTWHCMSHHGHDVRRSSLDGVKADRAPAFSGNSTSPTVLPCPALPLPCPPRLTDRPSLDAPTPKAIRDETTRDEHPPSPPLSPTDRRAGTDSHIHTRPSAWTS